MRHINRIVIHATAGWPHQTVEEIQKFWKNSLGWKSPGYHKLISTDGTIHNLAKLSQVTNGVAGYNSDSVHISYIGGLKEVTKEGKYIYGDTRTEEQKEAFYTAIKEVLEELKQYQEVDDIVILGHRDLSPDLNGDGKIEEREWIKVCPTFSVFDEFWWIMGKKALDRVAKGRKYY